MSDRSLDEFLPEGGDGANDDGVKSDDAGDPVAEVAADDHGGGSDDGGGDDTGDGPTDTGDGPAAGPGDARSTAAGTDPVVPTMRWTADGVPCDVCGATVGRRWRDGDAFVCDDCKAW